MPDDVPDTAEQDEASAVVGTPEAAALLRGGEHPEVKTDDPGAPDKAEHDEASAVVGTPEAEPMLRGGEHPEVKADDEDPDSGHGLLAYGLGPVPRTHRVLVYSSEERVRSTVRTAVGRQPAADLGRVEWVEAADRRQVLKVIDAGGVDLVVLDAESRPTGGLGLSKQLKDEIKDCPPFLLLVARQDDRWLARWSLADAVVVFPIDGPGLAVAVAEQLRARESGLPVRRASA